MESQTLSEKSFEKLNEFIKASILGRNRTETTTLQLLKAALLEEMKKKGAKLTEDGSLSKETELSIISKMVKTRKDTAEVYLQNNRPELAEKEITEMNILKEYLPEEPTKENIIKGCEDFASTVKVPSPKDMGQIIKYIKTKYPTADGKLVADTVKEYLTSL